MCVNNKSYASMSASMSLQACVSLQECVLPMYGHISVCKEACAYTFVCLYECLCVVIYAYVHVLVSSRSVTIHVGFWFMSDVVTVPLSG